MNASLNVVPENQNEGMGMLTNWCKKIGEKSNKYWHYLSKKPSTCPKLVTKVKSNINLFEVHPQLSNNIHLMDGAFVGVGFLCPIFYVLKTMKDEKIK